MSFDISVQKLCSGDWDRSIRLSVWDWNRYSTHPNIISCYMTFSQSDALQSVTINRQLSLEYLADYNSTLKC